MEVVTLYASSRNKGQERHRDEVRAAAETRGEIFCFGSSVDGQSLGLSLASHTQ